MRYYMFNKPRGCITACRDARHKTVMDYIPPEEQEGLFPIGRLDKDTEGLLIITDDGKLCFFVAAPDRGVTKTYRF
jgi:16S rRNA pseudouridine516 synthase